METVSLVFRILQLLMPVIQQVITTITQDGQTRSLNPEALDDAALEHEVLAALKSKLGE